MTTTTPCETCTHEAVFHEEQAEECRRELSPETCTDIHGLRIYAIWLEDRTNHAGRARRRAVTHPTQAHGPAFYDWSELQRCSMCGQDLPHDYVHWNGAFEQCERCAVLEGLDPDQNSADPIFGGTFSQGMAPIYGPER